MTVTRDQAQMLASLAVDCRPNRAPTWDPAGVLENIGKVRHLDLAEVALAVIRAAADREARTPGVIPATNGSHWQEQLKPPPFQPDSTWNHLRCSACGLHEADCRVRWSGDHDYRPLTAPLAAIDVTRTVDALREQVVAAKAARPEPPVVERVANPHVEELRHLANPTTAEEAQP